MVVWAMMQRFSPTFKSMSRFALVIAVTGSVVGCGSDAMRVDQSTLVNPFNGSSRFGSSSTSGVKPVQVAADQSGFAPVGSNRVVQASSLSAPLSPVSSAVASPAPAKLAASTKDEKKSWVAAGGKTITVAPGDSVKSLSERYNVPEKVLLAANNIKSAKTKLKPGSELVIPVNRNAAPVETALPVQGSNPQAPSKPQALVSSQAKIPQPPAQEVKAVAKDEGRKGKSPDSKAVEPEKTAKAEKGVKPSVSSKDVSENAPETTASLTPQQQSEPAASAEFRWPARGHIVQNFGEKGGVKSDGINIALPEGTPVKAAENGVVAYAGNELKGYGNLVLIRHDNGFVSAYANNGDLKVKKGDAIRRGQVIATSGQSGNVTSPQLHFELRKGSTPVDPMQYLTGN
jgi:murein DD-endopeptidase MepM/ murein hydrolase activator NlpD